MTLTPWREIQSRALSTLQFYACSLSTLDVFSEGSYDSTRHRVYEFRENALTSADNDDRADHGLVPLSKDGAI